MGARGILRTMGDELVGFWELGDDTEWPPALFVGVGPDGPVSEAMFPPREIEDDKIPF